MKKMRCPKNTFYTKYTKKNLNKLRKIGLTVPLEWQKKI